MKTIKYLVVMFFAAFVVSSCQNDDFVTIDSLSKFGDTYSVGDEVPVWMCVTTSGDVWHTEYEWGCSGGSFYGPTDIVRTVWIAPLELGSYDVWCTVTSGKAKETRSTVMNVLNYWYDDFETDSSGNYTAGTTTKTWIDPADNENELAVGAGELSVISTNTASASTNYTLYYTSGFSNTEFKQPFTASLDVAWRSNEEEGITGYDPDATDSRYYRLRLQFASPSASAREYFYQLHFDIYPWKEQTLLSTVDPDAEGFDADDMSNYNTNYSAQIILKNFVYSSTTTTSLVTGYNPILKMADGALAADGRGMSNFSLDMLEDFTVVGYFTPYGGERTEIFRSDYLATLEGLDQDFSPNNYAFMYQSLANTYIDNCTLNNIYSEE